jgi:antitoxin StbD
VLTNLRKWGDMDKIMTELTTSISEFKKNPNRELERAGRRPFAVLTNNRPSFYVLSPEVYDQVAELLFDINAAPTLLKRLEDRKNSVKVELEDL